MAWGEQAGLVERFQSTNDFLRQTQPRWKLGTSYDAWIGAQIREAPRIIRLVKRQLRKHIRKIPSRQPASRWNAFAVDGSKVACPRTGKNQQAMGDVGKPDGIPQMSLTAILHLETGLPWDFRVGPGTDSERGHLLDMLDALEARSLLVADAGFIGYELCCKLLARGIHFLLRVGGNIQLLKELGYEHEVVGDFVYLWPARQQSANQPPIKLRLIVVHDENKQPVYLVTSVLDSEALSDDEASEFYRQRWSIEGEFRTLKQTFPNHTMHSRTPTTCYLEMSWAFLGVWLLQLMTAREVAAGGDDPRRISPAQARNVVRRVIAGRKPGESKGISFLQALAACQVDSYDRRKPKGSRQYPRKKRHTPPTSPIMKLPTETQLRKAKQLTPIVMLI